MYGIILWIIITGLTFLNINYRAAAVLLLVGSSWIPIMRGNVGTDVAPVYLPIAAHPDHFLSQRGVVYVLVNLVIKHFAVGAHGVIIGIAILYCLLLLVYVTLASRNELIFFTYYYFPIFFYEYSMSQLRIGLASIFLLFVIKYIGRRRSFAWVIHAVLAVFTQFTSVVVVLYQVYLRSGYKKKYILLSLFMAMAAILIKYLVDQNYWQSKISLYFDGKFLSPSIYSGGSSVIIAAVALLGIYLENKNAKLTRKLIFHYLVFFIFGFVLARFSYSGLRVLGLFKLMLPLSLLVLYSINGKYFGKFVRLAFVISGFLGMVFFYRSIINEGILNGTIYDGSPFLPYRFW